MSTVRVDPDGNGDFVSIVEAVAQAVPGSIISLAPGEFRWPGRLNVDKVLSFEGNKWDPSDAPSTILNGRIYLCASDPEVWKTDAARVGAFKDIFCKCDSGYCLQVVNGKWDIYGCSFECCSGIAVMITSGSLSLRGCHVGGRDQDSLANNGVLAAGNGSVVLDKSRVRHCKVSSAPPRTPTRRS
mmetsp:Transcript_88243/g.234643  ORF Transcript_88243/g.234643 Transcript_88243/m.234643 type:complete len:185 (-) Transcript_88243:7-561(-)